MAFALTCGLASLATVLISTSLARADPHAEPRSQRDGSAAEVELVPGRLNTFRLQPTPGQPWERQPTFVSRVPSYRRGVILDGEQRWIEAAGAFQQALVEVGHAMGLDSSPLWERAAFKIDLERRRSRSLAHAVSATAPGAADVARPVEAARPAAVERARLLRLKLMSVRAATDAVPDSLAVATLSALRSALAQTKGTEGANSAALAGPRTPTIGPSTGSSIGSTEASTGGNPEVRLLLCATRAAVGDRVGARWELAHVAPSVRADPKRALPLAVCRAALGDSDEALASLAVAVYLMGPSSRFLPGQTRELESANDWDTLRPDPRFLQIFR